MLVSVVFKVVLALIVPLLVKSVAVIVKTKLLVTAIVPLLLKLSATTEALPKTVRISFLLSWSLTKINYSLKCGTIAVSDSSFDITATDFTNSGTISANTTLNTTLTSTANNSFTNTGGVLNSDTFALSVAGDFDYVADFNGTITTNSFNLNVGGDFSNNDSVNDFTWGTNDSLTVSGNANITANNYIQSGAIDVAGDWSINTANNFIYNRPNNVQILFGVQMIHLQF